MQKFHRHWYRRYAKRLLSILALVGIGIGLYFGLQTDYWKRITNTLKQNPLHTEENANVAEKATATSEFQDFLEKSSVQQLILRSTELIDGSQESLIVRLDRQEKKIQIADVLLQKKRDRRANTFGTVSKLKALRTRELINYDQGLTSEKSSNDLHEYTSLNVTSNDADIKREAQIGRLLAKLVRNTLFSDTETVTSFQPAIQEFKVLCDQYPNDSEMAAILYSYLERLHIRTSPTINEEFIKVFKTAYEKSDKEQLREMAETVSSRIVETEFDFVDIFAEVGSAQDQAIELLNTQIHQAFDRGHISQQGFVSIFTQINNIADAGGYSVATELSELLQRRIATNEPLRPLLIEINKLKRQYKLAGTSFSIGAISKLDGSTFNIRHPDAAVKTILFMNAEARKQSSMDIKFIMGVAGKYIAQGQFCLSVIYVDKGDNEQAVTELTNAELLVPVIDFGRVDANSEDGKKFLADNGVESFPHMIFLDRENKIAAVNVRRIDFDRRFHQLLSD